jgi:hypothetical protein
LDRLSGSHVRTAMNGAVEWLGSNGIAASLSGDATFKRSPVTPGFDLGSISLQPSVHLPWGRSSMGLGFSLQSLSVAGQHFREVGGVDASWTLADSDGMWGCVLESSIYKHSSDLSDMDAVSSSLVLLRNINAPFRGVDGIDFSAIAGREDNRRGFAELSNRSAMVSALIRWTWRGANFSAGRSWRQSMFDDTVFPGEPIREDRTAMLDLAVQMPLSPDRSVRLEFNESRNVSTTPLYNNLYHQLSVTLRSSF